MSEETRLEEFADSEIETESESEFQRELFGLGEVPAEWEIELLSESVEIIPGNSPPSSTYNENGDGLPFFQGNSEFGHFHPEADTWCSEPRKEADKSDVLMSIRAPVGDLNIADRRCCIGRGLAALQPETINGLYLFYNLVERQAWLSRLATGSTFKSVTKGDLQHLDIPVPPLEEQRKIATVLSTVDQAIQKTEEVIEQTRYIKQGLVNEIVINGIASESYKPMRVGPHEFKIPEHWKIVSITEACENLDNKRIPVSQSNREDMQGEIPYYGASGCVDYVDDYLFNEPLILLAEDGENLRSRTQRVAFKITGKSWINNHAHVLRPKSGFELDYLVEYLERLDYRPYVSGSAQPKLNQTMMNKITVPKPPVEEQEQIASVLNDFKSCIEDGQSYRDQLKRLKQGLMQDLLSGTVRTHDTDIEVLDDVLAHG